MNLFSADRFPTSVNPRRQSGHLGVSACLSMVPIIPGFHNGFKLSLCYPVDSWVPTDVFLLVYLYSLSLTCCLAVWRMTEWMRVSLCGDFFGDSRLAANFS